MYRIGDRLSVEDRMQKGYVYELAAPMGGGFGPGFTPRFPPKEMLALGVFEGKYINDCRGELPADWCAGARLSDTPDPALNRFGVKRRQSLAHWRKMGWIIGPDPRGWFQCYCRNYLGRRLAGIDRRQIKRGRAFARHARQIRAICAPGDLACRPRQRQALLQWSHDPFI